MNTNPIKQSVWTTNATGIGIASPKMAHERAVGLAAESTDCLAFESLRREVEELNDQNRCLARQFPEFRRCIHEERAERSTTDKESFIKGLVPVVGSLERAFACGTCSDSPVLLRGVEMALQQLRQLLRQHGREIEKSRVNGPDARPRGSNPHLYDASKDNQSILEMLQRNDRPDGMILRHHAPVGPADSTRARLIERAERPGLASGPDSRGP